MWRKREIMTLPDERYLSIQRARTLCEALCDPKQTPRVPRDVRLQALSVLRHFPSDWDLEQLAQARSDIIQQRMDPLHKMVLRHEQQQHTVIVDDHEGSTAD